MTPSSLTEQFLNNLVPFQPPSTTLSAPSLHIQPHLPEHLVAAERALRELAPGGPAAAGLLSDGRWKPPSWSQSGATTAGVLGDGTDEDEGVDTAGGDGGEVDAAAEAVDGGGGDDGGAQKKRADEKKAARKAAKKENMKKYEEYFLRYQLPARLAASTNNDNEATTKAAASAAAAAAAAALSDGYTAEVPALDTKMEEGVVATGEFGVVAATDGAADGDDGREVAMDAYDAAEAAALAKAGGGDVSAVANVAVDVDREHVDGAAKEMMDQLKREANAYVNPQTGKAIRWGDTWRHEWGGGVGVGRPESRPRRMMPDGTTQIMPAKTDKGYALVWSSTLTTHYTRPTLVNSKSSLGTLFQKPLDTNI